MSNPWEREPASNVPGGAVDRAGVALVTYFQPFYNLRSGRLQGLEALARQRNGPDDHPEPPAAFLATATARGGMRDIDLRILDDSLAQLSRWRRDPARNELILSVNLSWDFVAHPDVTADVNGALTRHGVPGDRILVDITTETFRRLTSADDDALARLCRLQENEVSFCIDGFTVDDLDVLPDAVAVAVDIIKLHPRKLLGTPAAEWRLADVAQAVQDVGVPVVAAGVETREQLDRVRHLGFEWAQGFLHGEPTAADGALSHPPSLAFD